MAPVAPGTADKLFISESFDPTSHFETAIADVMGMYATARTLTWRLGEVYSVARRSLLSGSARLTEEGGHLPK